KLLDFGLAKPQAVVAAGFTKAGTEKQLTAEGTIVGTFHYMAPEQLEGESVDARTDIFAFGAVLYEMITGRRAFEGKTKTSLIASIVSADPPSMSSLQPVTPPALERLVRHCLAKNPDDRWQTAHDVLLELQWIAEGGSGAGVAAPVAARRKQRERWAWIALAAVLLLALAGWAVVLRELGRPAEVVKLSLGPPEKVDFAFDRGSMALSPDGKVIAFVGRTGERVMLFVRRLDSMTAQPLPGTNRALFPFWSPDSRFIGFFADGKLKKIDARGGPAQILADAPIARGGSWSSRGVIVFAPNPRGVLHRIPVSGGVVTPLTRMGTRESTHRWPHFLPDGNHFLYLSQQTFGQGQAGDSVHLASLDQPHSSKLLMHANSNVVWADGHLLFHRDRTLMAQRFDLKTLQLSGEAFPVADQLQFLSNSGEAIFSVSQNGVLAYQSGPGGGVSTLTWFDLTGRELGTVGPPADYGRPRISPDGRRVVVDVIDPRSGNGDLWIYDVPRRISSRFTFDPALDVNPTWSPDGAWIVFNSPRLGASELYRKAASGEGTEEMLWKCPTFCAPFHWSRDGRFIAVQVMDENAKWDLWLWSVHDRRASPLLHDDSNEMGGHFSPDGRWIVYTSDESGQTEVYVRQITGGSGRWQVSAAGGYHPVWSADGSQIFYLSQDDELMAISIVTTPIVQMGEAKKLFPTRLKSVPGRRYDVGSDGKQVLINTVTEARPEPVTIVLNWPAELAGRR
ncbi:MAG TPA: protein kinase, partial [Thermoanaerobaculia bacterium]|nr:protein kinase [Thermoanaerobaculia bacterium]